MLEMTNIVWSKLWELGFADTLPEQQRVREWIKGNAPDYVREAYHAKNNIFKAIFTYIKITSLIFFYRFNI